MSALQHIVLDVLKPHDSPVLEFAERLADVKCVDGVTSSLIELDQEVQNIKLTIEGEDLDYAVIEAEVDGLGGTIHSVDRVGYGEYIVEERRTPQDD